jgi:hypothetical protein
VCSTLLGSPNCLACLIIHTIGLDPSGAGWIDEASNVSRPDRSGVDQVDVDPQATDLAVRFEPLTVRVTAVTGSGFQPLVL